jgi:hypothetical protein
MWMVEPPLMCDRHLLGEHVECHMLAGTLARGRRIDGFIEKRLLEPSALRQRHDELVAEMDARGFRHASPLPRVETRQLSPEARECRVDVARSHGELLARCEACRERGRDTGG